MRRGIGGVGGHRLAGVARVVLLVTALIGGVGACAANGSGVGGMPAGSDRAGVGSPSATGSAAQITVQPGSGGQALRPAEPLRVLATDGWLTSVLLRDPQGVQYPGIMDASQHRWQSSAVLPRGTTLTYHVTAVDASGRSRTVVGDVRTMAPSVELSTAISPLGGWTLGVGMPIVVRFNADIADRAAVESHLHVRASRPVEGVWSWVGDREVHWRPRQYWPAYTDVRLDVALAGVDAGDGVWGVSNESISFRIGASMVSTVNVDTLRMQVRRDGRVVRTVPITTGKGGFLTRGGTKVILEKHTMQVMDASTIGISKDDPEYYRLDVPWALRVTWSGEFLHAAPWSVAAQGRVNVSHGCVGMSMRDGEWFFRQSQVGDIVIVVNSPRRLEPGNGYTDWNVTWSDWLAGSSTGPETTAPVETTPAS